MRYLSALLLLLVCLPAAAQETETEKTAAREVLKKVRGIAFTFFGTEDVVRHPLVQRIVNAYENREKNSARSRSGKPDDAIKTLAEDPSWGTFAAPAHEVRGDAFFAKHDVAGAVKEYQAALGAGDAGSGDAALLQLKIADLSAPSAATPSATDPSNKAKP